MAIDNKLADPSSRLNAGQQKELRALATVDRTVDELKDRYYKVARAILMARGLTDHALVRR